MQLQGYLSASDNDEPDTVAKQSADGTKAVLPSGEVVDLVKQGNPSDIDVALRISDSAVYMPSPFTPHQHIDGTKNVWGVLGVYTGTSGITTTLVTEFPIFNIINYNTMKQYRVPASMLPQAYDTTAYPSTPSSSLVNDNGHNGTFSCGISADGKTLVIARVRYQLDTVTGTPTNFVAADDITTATMKVSWNIIKDYGFDDAGHVLTTETGTTITGGNESYDYAMWTISGIGGSSDPPVAPSGGGWTFAGWFRGSTNYNMNGDPVIWFDGSTPHIDIFGRWTAAVVSAAGYSDGVNPGYENPDSQFQTYTIGGMFAIEDIQDGASVVDWQDWSGFTNFRVGVHESTAAYPSIQTGYITTDVTSISTETNGLLVNRDNRTGLSTSSSSSGNKRLAYRSTAGSAATGYRASAVGTPDRFYHNYPWLSFIIPGDFAYTNSFSDNYIGDTTRMYPVSNANTGWQTRYNSGTSNRGFIKTTGTGKFTELRVTESGFKVTEVSKWRYDSDSGLVVSAGSVKTKGTGPLLIFSSSGTIADASPNPITLMDFNF